MQNVCVRYNLNSNWSIKYHHALLHKKDDDDEEEKEKDLQYISI